MNADSSADGEYSAATVTLDHDPDTQLSVAETDWTDDFENVRLRIAPEEYNNNGSNDDLQVTTDETVFMDFDRVGVQFPGRIVGVQFGDGITLNVEEIRPEDRPTERFIVGESAFEIEHINWGANRNSLTVKIPAQDDRPRDTQDSVVVGRRCTIQFAERTITGVVKQDMGSGHLIVTVEEDDV
jgi:hypothetical protein